MDQKDLVAKAAELLGGIAALAVAIGVKPPTVYQWLNGTRPVPAKQCPRIERATGGAVTAEQLRPDVFLPPQTVIPVNGSSFGARIDPDGAAIEQFVRLNTVGKPEAA